MRKKNTENISEILQEFFNENETLKQKIAQNRAVRGWNELLGKTISSYTTNIYFRNGILYVYLSSSVLRSELSLAKDRLIKNLNDYAGMQIIDEIIFR